MKIVALSALCILQASTLFSMEMARPAENPPLSLLLFSMEMARPAENPPLSQEGMAVAIHQVKQIEEWRKALEEEAAELEASKINPQTSQEQIQKHAQLLLKYACCLQDTAHARIALNNGADINFRYRSEGDKTPLALVMRYFNPSRQESEEFLRFLLATPGLDINVCDSIGRSAFIGGCFNDTAVTAIRILLEYKDKLNPKINLNAFWRSPLSALHVACIRRNVEIVKLLCLHPEIDPNVQDRDKRTPLYQMMLDVDYTTKRAITIAHILTDKGASFECKSSKGTTAIDEVLDQYQLRENECLMLALGAHLTPEHFKRLRGMQPSNYRKHTDYELSFIRFCYLWATEGNLEAIEKLTSDLPKYAVELDLNCKDTLGLSPFIWAAARGRIDLAQALYTYRKVNVNMQDDFGDTALHYAARNCHPEMVNYLLSLPEIDTSIKNCMGLTAFAITKNCQQWAPTKPSKHDAVINVFNQLFKWRQLFLRQRKWEKRLPLDVARLICQHLRLEFKPESAKTPTISRQ